MPKSSMVDMILLSSHRLSMMYVPRFKIALVCGYHGLLLSALDLISELALQGRLFYVRTLISKFVHKS